MIDFDGDGDDPPMTAPERADYLALAGGLTTAARMLCRMAGLEPRPPALAALVGVMLEAGADALASLLVRPRPRPRPARSRPRPAEEEIPDDDDDDDDRPRADTRV